MTTELLDAALARWAKLQPEATAVRFGGDDFSYKCLDQTADAVAGYLAQAGIGMGDRVGLYAAKSFETIAAVFGILRAGAAFVPIDLVASDARVDAIVDGCALALVLADDPNAQRLPDAQPVAHLADAVKSKLPPARVARSTEALAYILYTSGSTGVPKGICHTHHSGWTYACKAADVCALTPQDRVSHQTPLHFDMSIFDVFSTIYAGATIVVIPEIHTKVPASLSALVQDETVTVWYSVPFALAQLTTHGALDARDLSALRVVMFAGEVMPPKVLKDIAPHVPNAVFLNAYGPTETNHCTTAQVERNALDGVTAVPIGTPGVGTVARVSETGELLIASDQVMQGYWNDPARTDDAFVVIDHGGAPLKFYRTGDLVTPTKDHGFLLIGRADRQIKIRGYRIELDEIELVISRCPGVQEVAVIVEDNSIHAFVTGSSDLEEIRSCVAAHLPPHAVPEKFIQLPALARTSTGKIDRNTLSGLNNDRSAA